MSSLIPNGACFFAKASESINWLWHKRLPHLNFKNINKLAKQNKVLGLPSLVYSKDKPCLASKKGSTIELHSKLNKTSLSGSVCIFFIWIYLDQKVENQNDVKVKQIRTNNGTEFRNHEIESFCDEKGISQNFSSPYTPGQNGVAERKNRTLIEAARTMLNGSVLSKHFWTEAVRIACKLDAKADDGYFLGYSFVSKAFRVFNTRRQQVEETYHVTFDESMEATRITNTSRMRLELMIPLDIH
ncbi:retrovirus-related pol polyprotein from transposon TNT 1-94 [Tanacetum coccineum]